ncbi:MAG: exodeoxyribonuclease V subunit gamma [Moraxella sp.]|nr:exodeoxyribonuclease V subunit gamma [Moraxella sp.]
MFKIIQSNDITTLADHLSDLYQHDGRSIFEPFVVITPAKVLGEWLEKYIAKRTGVSTLVFSQFWGQYQWTLVQNILSLGNDYLAAQGWHDGQMFVPEVAMLSKSVVQWRIFGFLLSEVHGEILAKQILQDDTHPLHGLIAPIADGVDVPYHRLWQLSSELAGLYVKYLTLRPEWLHRWANGDSVDVPSMIAKKDKMESFYQYYAEQYKSDEESELMEIAEEEMSTPAWLFDHYVMLETALHYLWRLLFGASFLFREHLEERFWQILAGQGAFVGLGEVAKNSLPKQLYLFTVQQIPPVELEFLQRLSRYMDVILLHFNPSAEFWADTVDKQWLLTQRLVRADSVYLREYGHGLLSRLGKESRQTFAMLADMSGGVDFAGDVVAWEDRFVHRNGQASLLSQLKQDILLLDETGVHTELGQQISQSLLNVLNDKIHQSRTTWQMNADDDSLSIHSCHSLKRQLEVVRLMIVKWLNTPNADGTARQLSDIAVFLPDMEESRELVSAVFPSGRGLDGFYLPAKITGVTDKAVDALWQAISGFFNLVSQTRFYYAKVCDWLMLPQLYESFGLDFEQMSRACELLAQAGFVRGFDAIHLQKTLHKSDEDYRYSFAFALDRIVAGLLLTQTGGAAIFHPFIWQNTAWHNSDEQNPAWHNSNEHNEQNPQSITDNPPELTEPLTGVSLADMPIVQALCAIFAALTTQRHAFDEMGEVGEHLARLENGVIKPYFTKYQGTPQLLAVFTAINALGASIRASSHDGTMPMSLPFGFVLESVGDAVKAQQVSSEPSGVITFGRFGSLRSIAFELVIMLDMNLASFPRSDYHNRLDLTRAGMRERGDRLNEDDDNGAFLEALLSARQACWIFYTGQSADGTVLLPANPVSELINFLTHEPRWIGDVMDSDTQALPYLPKLIEEWLVVKHAALPFERGVFEETITVSDPKDGDSSSTDEMLLELLKQAKRNQQLRLPPAMVWQNVYQALTHHRTEPMDIITLPSRAAIAKLAKMIQDGSVNDDWQDLPSSIEVASLAAQIANPAMTFLRGKIAVIHKDIKQSNEEPLHLNALDDWVLTNQLLTNDGSDKSSSLYYGDSLPAGVARLTITQQKQQQIQALKAVLADNLITLFGDMADISDVFADNLINPVISHKAALNIGSSHTTISLQSSIPADNPSTWHNISASKLRAKQLLRAWLMHVYWQLVRTQTDSTHDGISVWQFVSDELGLKTLQTLNGMVVFTPMSKVHATAELQKWLRFLAVIRQNPIALTADNALIYLDNYQDDDVNWAKLYQGWQNSSHTDFVPESCSQHPAWQVILGQADALTALMDCVDLTAVYQGLINGTCKVSNLTS